jgi:hypothetical protein
MHNFCQSEQTTGQGWGVTWLSFRSCSHPRVPSAQFSAWPLGGAGALGKRTPQSAPFKGLRGGCAEPRTRQGSGHAPLASVSRPPTGTGTGSAG